jgi:hypothetical protein
MSFTCPVHLILRLVNLILLGEEYMLWVSLVCSFAQPPVTQSLFDPNILLSTLFSNTVNLRFSLNVKDQVSRPYRTPGQILNYRIKGKVVPVLNWTLRHEGIWGSGCIDPRILDLNTSWRWMVSLTPRPFTPGIGAGLVPELVCTTWRKEIYWAYRDLNFDPSVTQPVASRHTDCATPASV